MYEPPFFPFLVYRLELEIQRKNEDGQIMRYPFQEERKCVSGTVNYTISTDFQGELELLRVTVRGDKLHGDYDYYYCVY